MNIKRYIIAAIVLFAFTFSYESYVHGVLLNSIYHETPNIWRAEADMISFMPFNIAVLVILALWITFIFTKFYPHGGAKNGLRFGFYIGVLAGIQAAGAYFYLPISSMLALYWFVAYVLESTVAGLLIGAIYKN